MAEQCVFCKEQIDSTYPPRLEENKMFMFEILMEQTSFDKDLLINSPMCEDCDKTILNFFNFKSKFMETEDEFINYMNADKKVDLYDVLVKTYKVKRFENENVPIKVCRICFKATQVKEYKEIKSLESKLATIVTLCLPEVNIKLTNQTHLCSECYSIILQYYHFLLLCIEATKLSKTDTLQESFSLSKKITTSESDDCDPLSRNRSIGSEDSEPTDPSPRKRTVSEASEAFLRKEAGSDPLALDNGEPQDKRQRFEEDTWSDSSEPLSPLSLLLPVDPPKRGRGRPRKGEEVNKPGPNRKNLQKQKLRKKYDTVRTRQDAASNSTMPTDMGIDVDSYECQVCPEIFPSLKEIQDHIEVHETQSSFFCWRCGYECYNFGALCTHYDSHDMGLFKIIRHKESIAGAKNVADIYTPPELKKKRGRKRKNFAQEATSKKTSTSSSTTSTGTPASSSSSATSSTSAMSSTSTSTNRSTLNELSVVVSHNKQPSGGTKKQDVLITGSSQSRNEAPSDLTISCPECKQNFTHIDYYMKHSCAFKPKTYNLEENVKEREFGCGHCCAVFYSLDDLDDHNCISTKVVTQGGNVPLTTSEKCDVNTVPTTNNDRPSLPRTEVLSKDTEPDYECSYCLLTFHTITGLDKHTCRGDSENTPTLKIPNVPIVKKETIFECSYCMSLFESSFEVDQHRCPNMPAFASIKAISATSTHVNSASTAVNSPGDDVNPASTTHVNYATTVGNSPSDDVNRASTTHVNYASTVGNSPSGDVNRASTTHVNYASTVGNSPSDEVNTASTDAISADGVGDCISQLIKSEPEYDCFLPPDSEIELENTVCDNDLQEEKKDGSESLSSELASENTDDVSNSKNVGDEEKSIPDKKAMSNEEKKQVINRIANMFGVKIVEGKERSKDQDKNDKYNCMGCDFRGVDARDLMIHVGFCDTLLRCSHCSFHTNILQKLEVHSYLIHHIVLFPCSDCTFITSMEENYLAHIKIHSDSKKDVSNDVLCISDEEEEEGSANIDRPLESTGNSLDGNNSPGPKELLNGPLNFDKVKLVNVAKPASRIINQKRYAMLPVSENGSQVDPVKSITDDQPTPTTTTPNLDGSRQVIDSAASAEAILPIDLEDEDEPDITKLKAQTDINDTTEDHTDDNDPLSTEPVWLVKSSSVTENAAERKIANETSTLPDEIDACQPSEDQIELIIPDRIIPEPSTVKLEPSQDPLQITKDTGSLQSDIISQEHCSQSSKSQEICSKSSILQEPRSRPLSIVAEPGEIVCIQCDSDSDSEFVESSESLLSSVAACAVEAVAISASEASKLISEGVLVINESSLVAMQAESSPTADEVSSCPDTVASAEDQSLTPLHLNPVKYAPNSTTESTEDRGKETSRGKHKESAEEQDEEYTEDKKSSKDKDKECRAVKDIESVNDKNKESAEEKDKESTEDRCKETSTDKHKESAEEQDEEYTEYKNKESSEDRNTECSVDKDNESANDKNKGSAEKKINESTEDRGKETSTDKHKESAEEQDEEYTEDMNKESSKDRDKECSADKDSESANDKNKGSAEEKDKESTEDKSEESTDNKENDCNKSNNENINESNSSNTDSLQAEATELLCENEESLVNFNIETQAPNGHTSEKARTSVPKDNDILSAKIKNKFRVIIETELEAKASDSDGSSIFVTDDEDSDVDGVKEAPTMPGIVDTLTKPQPTKTNECDEEVLIIDDEDENEISKPIPAVPNVVGNNTILNVLPTTKSNHPIFVSTGPTSIPNVTEIEPPAKSSKNTAVNKAANSCAVNAEDSFVISDDEEEGAGKDKDSNTGFNTATETVKTGLDILAADFASKVKQNNFVHPQKAGGASVASMTKSAIEYVRKVGSYSYPGLRVESSSASKEAVKNPTAHAAPSRPSAKKNNILKTNVALAKTAKISAVPAKKIVKNKAALGEAAKNAAAAAPFSRTVDRNEGNSIKKIVISKKTTASSTCTKTISGNKGNSIRKTAVPNKTAGKAVEAIQKPTYVVIDDDDDSDGGGKVDDKTIEPRSRSESSSITLDRGFSEDTADEPAKESDSGDDCVFISEVEAQSKNVRPSNPVPPKRGRPPAVATDGVKRPPNALHLFTSKVKREIQFKYPKLKWMEQKNIIWEAWKSMSDENKFPFQEEARLHRLLFKREHPEFTLTNKKVVIDPLAVQQTADIEEIVVD